LASHTAAKAKGSGSRSSCAASDSTTGVNRTAVVSRLRTIVVRVPRASTSKYSRRTLPPASRAARVAATSNSSAASDSSAKTVTATRNSRTGATRVVTSTASDQGSSRVGTARIPRTAATSHTTGHATSNACARGEPAGRSRHLGVTSKLRAPPGRVTGNPASGRTPAPTSAADDRLPLSTMTTPDAVWRGGSPRSGVGRLAPPSTFFCAR